MITERTILILSTMVGFTGMYFLFTGQYTTATFLLIAGTVGCTWVSWKLK